VARLAGEGRERDHVWGVPKALAREIRLRCTGLGPSPLDTSARRRPYRVSASHRPRSRARAVNSDALAPSAGWLLFLGPAEDTGPAGRSAVCVSFRLASVDKWAVSSPLTRWLGWVQTKPFQDRTRFSECSNAGLQRFDLVSLGIGIHAFFVHDHDWNPGRMFKRWTSGFDLVSLGIGIQAFFAHDHACCF
jgi:hypothetical protein